MFSHKDISACVALAALAACAANTPPTPRPGEQFGRTATAQEVAAWDISIPPSGEGLPSGSGNARQGEAVYVAKCQACHGAKGAGKPADPLAGGIGSLPSANPDGIPAVPEWHRRRERRDERRVAAAREDAEPRRLRGLVAQMIQLQRRTA